MVDIIKEILSHLPEGKISDASFEGANIVLYTKDKEYFLNSGDSIRSAVSEFKKRIEIRPDPILCIPLEEAEKKIRKLVPEEAVVTNVTFDPQRSMVIIETEKPGVAIGKQGSVLKEIREATCWVPLIQRTPAIKSILIENIRSVLYIESDYRRKFLNKIGHRIYDGWIRDRKNEWVRLTYLGSGRQVGRSCLFLQTQESRVLLDCGINVAGIGPDMYPYLDAPEFNLSDLDAVILSHAHLDHCGFIPYLFKYGFRGPVYCTAPTRDISALLLLDYVKIMKNEGVANPLYDVDDVKEMVKHMVCLDYDEVSDVTPDVRITFHNAGHILGSAMVHMHIGNGMHNFLYTADLRYARTQLLEPATTSFPRLETVLMESTYGGRLNILPPLKEQDDYLKAIIKETMTRGGKVLMPVLGSGKAQEVMVMIEAMHRAGELPEGVSVYVDGMVWDVTAIYTAYPEFLNSIVRKSIFHKDENPFISPIFKKVGSHKERMQIVEDMGSCIILATSGMLVGGPSVEYLKHLSENPKNSLVFSSYQGEGSLGRRIQGGEREFIFKSGTKQEVVRINLEVHKLEISDHADRKQLMNFIYKLDPRPKKVLLNHGEVTRCLDLASSIHKLTRIETIVPRNLESIRLR